MKNSSIIEMVIKTAFTSVSAGETGFSAGMF